MEIEAELVRLQEQNQLLQQTSLRAHLLADPEVTIQDKGEVHHLIARTATPAEKEELWPVAVAEWPDYENYQLRTERDIPLVICEYPS